MITELSAIIFLENGWQVAQCIEIDVASQGNTEEEALQNLQEAVKLFFQAPCSSKRKAFAESVKDAQIAFPHGKLRTWPIE